MIVTASTPAAPTMQTNPLEELTQALRRFAAERDWEQFHTPKNLAMSVLIEAAEIAEHFQWSDATRNPALPVDKRDAVALEIGDTLLYLLRLADILDIDPIAAANAKMTINAKRYPIEKSFGKSAKYNEL